MAKPLLKSVKKILSLDPQVLYSEEKEFLNKPFYFTGSNGRAVLLIHGWSSTPYEVRRLGKYLHESGYTVFGPQLKGHGTVPKDLENVKWTDWITELEKAYDSLSKDYKTVFVMGTSIGSNLAILLASQRKNISGLVLMATPYKIKLEKLTVIFARSLKFLRPYNKKFYPPTFGLSTSITRLISYQSYPVKSALETFNLIKIVRTKLGLVHQPCLLIQSANDHIVNKKSMEEIYKRISSVKKKKIYIKRAYHTFISDIKNSHVFEDILEFINSIDENRNLHQ